MRPRFRSSSLVPAGFVVDHLDSDADRVGLVVRSGAAVATCPDCGTPSRRHQSRYRRRAADLPLGGTARRAPDRRTTLLVWRSCLQAEDLRRALSR